MRLPLPAARVSLEGGHGPSSFSPEILATVYPSARGLGRSQLMLPQHADQHRRSVRSSSQPISNSAKARLSG
jgi:hypothetical protein